MHARMQSRQCGLFFIAQRFHAQGIGKHQLFKTHFPLQQIRNNRAGKRRGVVFVHSFKKQMSGHYAVRIRQSLMERD